MPKHDDYKPSNPEYDFWNDKNLYPSLRDDEEDLSAPRGLSSPEDHKTGFGAVFLVAFLWLLFFAPFAFFLTWEDGIVQFIFWGGLAIVLVTYAVAFYNALQEYRNKHK